MTDELVKRINALASNDPAIVATLIEARDTITAQAARIADLEAQLAKQERKE
jgi:hypothetical protein